MQAVSLNRILNSDFYAMQAVSLHRIPGIAATWHKVRDCRPEMKSTEEGKSQKSTEEGKFGSPSEILEGGRVGWGYLICFFVLSTTDKLFLKPMSPNGSFQI